MENCSKSVETVLCVNVVKPPGRLAVDKNGNTLLEFNGVDPIMMRIRFNICLPIEKAKELIEHCRECGPIGWNSDGFTLYPLKVSFQVPKRILEYPFGRILEVGHETLEESLESWKHPLEVSSECSQDDNFPDVMVKFTVEKTGIETFIEAAMHHRCIENLVKIGLALSFSTR